MKRFLLSLVSILISLMALSAEPGTNVGATLSQLQRFFPSLRYVKTDQQGVHYHDGEDPTEGVNCFFVIRDNIVVEECLIVQDTNDFAWIWWRKMCDKFYNEKAYWNVIPNPYHYQFFYSTFKIDLIFMEENGVNTSMIVFSKL